jgi:hypothetical protein
MTYTPTHTFTPIAFPYVLRIGVYNEAGELVKTIVVERTNAVMSDVSIRQNGSQTGTITNGVVEFYVPGVETPLTFGSGESTFVWDASNDGSQGINNGIYYFKFEQKDYYGHTYIISKSITLLKMEQYVAVNIYNSAGELVRSIKEAKATLPANVSLGMGTTIPLENSGAGVKLNYGGPMDFVMWDGKNDLGMTVSSGVYQIQVEIKTLEGSVVQAGKSVTILTQKQEFLGGLKAYPNPYVGTTGGKMTIEWEPGATGLATVFIYNLKGELVQKLTSQLASGKAEWDLRTREGSDAAPGVYVCLVTAQSDQGRVERRKIKISVMIKHQDESAF